MYPAAPRRLLLLTALTAVVGLLAGGAAWVLLHLIGLLTNAALFHRFGWNVPSFVDLTVGPSTVAAALIGGLLVSVLAAWAPAIRGHGIPEAMEAVLIKQSRVAPRMAVAKPISAAIAIGTGGPFGAEGPIIVTGGAIGSIIGQVIDVSPSERKILLASGAAAGMAATFGAPLAAVVLAIELLLFEFSTRAFVPLVVAASVAGGVHALLLGSGPLFAVPHHHFAGLGSLPVFGVLGLSCGLFAVVISKGLFLVEHGFRRLPVSEFWHPIIGAAGFVTVGFVVPTALGVGYDRIGAVLTGRVAIGTLAVLGIAKLIAWWVALGSGTSGGTLAPLLLIGGCFGALFGHVVGSVAPGLDVSVGSYALVAMAATFGSASGARFTSIVFLFELTGDYQLILPLMLATVLAELVASSLVRDRLMTEKLSRRGLTVQGDYHADILLSTRVAQVMSSPVSTLAADRTIAGARADTLDLAHNALPIVDTDDRCVGIVSRQDLLLSSDGDQDAPVLAVANRDVVSVASECSLLDALSLLLEEEVDHLPVIDDGRLVGMCTR
ncbi:MAG: chloride channel protein, partial [Actinomycetota bacterium]|nr:chloride channel protein [Actinomycetota bacterium]